MAKTIDEQSKTVEVTDKKTFTLDRLRTDCLNLFSVASAKNTLSTRYAIILMRGKRKE